MKVGITSIQRDRNPWIVEWLAFHLLVGVEAFHLYLHECRDGMPETLVRLSRAYPIQLYTIGNVDKPQLAAYRHAWATHGQDIDWMAFIDGDEFLMPTAADTLPAALEPYAAVPLSALGVYWICYGSSGHVGDPGGLLMERFPRHSAREFGPNRHMKTILRGRQPDAVDFINSHFFLTARGTFNEHLEPIAGPVLREPHAPPTYDALRINHYVTQHWEFFKNTKQNMGAADVSPLMVRPDAWFHHHDRNECDDGASYRFLVRLKLKVRELQDVLAR